MLVTPHPAENLELQPAPGGVEPQAALGISVANPNIGTILGRSTVVAALVNGRLSLNGDPVLMPVNADPLDLELQADLLRYSIAAEVGGLAVERNRHDYCTQCGFDEFPKEGTRCGWCVENPPPTRPGRLARLPRLGDLPPSL